MTQEQSRFSFHRQVLADDLCNSLEGKVMMVAAFGKMA